MPISFDRKQKLFHLTNDQISYYLMINEKGLLQHLYFGSSLEKLEKDTVGDLGWDWSKTYLDQHDNEKRYEDAFYNDRSLMELAAHGEMDKRGAPIILQFADGTTKTKWIYQSHRIYQGKPSDELLPMSFADAGAVDSLEIILEEEERRVKVVLTLSLFKHLPIITRNLKIIKLTKEKVSLLRAHSLQLDLPRANYDLLHFHGDWSLERQLERLPLGHGKRVVASNNGRSSHEENPFVILADPLTGEESGEAIGFSLVYSGGFSAVINVDKWETTRVMMGLDDEDLCWDLTNDFVAPEGVMVYSKSGFGALSRAMHDWIRQHLIADPLATRPRPLLFNSWEGCFLDFSTDIILQYLDDAKKIGAELFVLDDGWFGERNYDDRSLGDWVVNQQKIDLPRVIEACHQKGMKFGLWFEPEMINPNSHLYRRHPQYALGKQGSERTLSRHQLVLDTSNDKALAEIWEQMCRILDTYAIDYIKWDHNRNIGETYSSTCRPGEVKHRLVLGTYRLMRNLRTRYPHIFLENCASGGGRFDLGMLYFSPQIWTSDETDPIQRLFIQYGTSFAYPLSAMGSHISRSPITNYQTKANIALFGTYGLEMNPCLLKDDEKAMIIKANELYHRYHHEVIQHGDLYRLASPFTSNYMAMMSINKQRTCALVLFANLLKENNRYRFLKIPGLKPDAYYRNDYENAIHLGQYYAEIGLNLSRWLDEFQSFLIIIEEVSKADYIQNQKEK